MKNVFFLPVLFFCIVNSSTFKNLKKKSSKKVPINRNRKIIPFETITSMTVDFLNKKDSSYLSRQYDIPIYMCRNLIKQIIRVDKYLDLTKNPSLKTCQKMRNKRIGIARLNAILEGVKICNDIELDSLNIICEKEDW